jgi:(1->4)-alpha-D-glucan 1-alpha-D-glucosylmutase
MSSELNVLARRLDRICQQHRHTRDFTLDSLRFALREIISCFPVYRTYTREDQEEIDDEDRRHIEAAIGEASRRNPAVSSSVFEAIGRILLLNDSDGITAEHKAERRLFVMRFQQLTGPVTAKGVEDTAFYRRYPLASLNEVGGEPESFGLTPEDFHSRILQRFRYWPHNMLATSTHDTAVKCAVGNSRRMESRGVALARSEPPAPQYR